MAAAMGAGDAAAHMKMLNAVRKNDSQQILLRRANLSPNVVVDAVRADFVPNRALSLAVASYI